MKKIYGFLVLVTALFSLSYTKIEASFFLEIDSQVFTQIDEVTHRHISGSITYNGVKSNQVIQYMGGNPFTDPNLHVIVGDDYAKTSYQMRPLPTMAQAVNQRYDSLHVIGGVNGDFYNMQTGIPVEAYVRNGEVISSGLGYHRPVIGFKDDGSVVIGRPCFEGREVTVFDADMRERITLPVNRINNIPFDSTQVSAYFENHSLTIPTSTTKIVLEGLDIKLDSYDTRYFGRGKVVEITTNPIDVEPGHFVVVSDNPYIKELVQLGDILRVQDKLGCEFEGVRDAIGAWEKLVEDGFAIKHIPHGTAINFRAPRTAIGIKPDQSVFFVTVDGRQTGRSGMTLYEMGELMALLGAEVAYNLDGGGSTAMVLENEGSYIYVNAPSDPGGPRSLSNGLFFARGTRPMPLEPHPIPDLSRALDVPGNVHVSEGVISWDHVADRSGYVIELNGELYETLSRSLPVQNLPPGIYEMRVKAMGEGAYTKDSEFSETLYYIVYPESLNSIEETVKRFGRGVILN